MTLGSNLTLLSTSVMLAVLLSDSRYTHSEGGVSYERDLVYLTDCIVNMKALFTMVT